MLTIDVQDAVTVTINLKMLNIHNSREIQQQLSEIARIHNKNIIINLQNVTSLDSSTISMLVDFNNHLKETGRELSFINPSPFVKKIFEMIHISKFFTIT
ncbi:MAG: STAS domain-containing protein [Spirochaetes bacterium]|nr:STAS domain-containing protein [Spirochaetota bacterium]